MWAESDQTKYSTEVLKRPISLKFYKNYKNFTSVVRQRNYHQQKSGYELQRPETQTDCVSSFPGDVSGRRFVRSAARRPAERRAGPSRCHFGGIASGNGSVSRRGIIASLVDDSRFLSGFVRCALCGIAHHRRRPRTPRIARFSRRQPCQHRAANMKGTPDGFWGSELMPFLFP